MFFMINVIKTQLLLIQLTVLLQFLKLCYNQIYQTIFLLTKSKFNKFLEFFTHLKLHYKCSLNNNLKFNFKLLIYLFKK